MEPACLTLPSLSHFQPRVPPSQHYARQSHSPHRPSQPQIHKAKPSLHTPSPHPTSAPESPRAHHPRQTATTTAHGRYSRPAYSAPSRYPSSSSFQHTASHSHPSATAPRSALPTQSSATP